MSNQTTLRRRTNLFIVQIGFGLSIRGLCLYTVGQVMKQAGKIHKDCVYAFIDKQTLNLVTRDHGWILDLAKFRKYLQKAYAVEKAFLFIRYFDQDKEMHKTLQKAGYLCLFISPQEKDEEYALDVVLRDKTFEKAIIVSGKDEYHLLIEKLAARNKLSKIVIPQTTPPESFNKYQEFIVNLGGLREKLEKGRV